MRYVHSPRAKRRFRVGPMLVTAMLVLAFAGAFAWSVKAFRSEASDAKDADSADDLGPVNGTHGGVVSSTVAAIPERALADREATLVDLRNSLRVGVARRGVEDGLARRSDEATAEGKPYVEIVMSPPPIDRETQAYEAWAVRALPYDYFSLGEAVTNDLGEFTVRWEGEKGATVDDYTRVVVTLEKKDGDPDPGEQVIKGVFGAD